MGCDEPKRKACKALERNISIHAPIVGCDCAQLFLAKSSIVISIHAPIVGCDATILEKDITSKISIHAPIVGCDLRMTRMVELSISISIHAPIVGCDLSGSFGMLKAS